MTADSPGANDHGQIPDPAAMDLLAFLKSLTPRARAALTLGVAIVLSLLTLAFFQLSRPAGLVGALVLILAAGAAGYLFARTAHLTSWFHLCLRQSRNVISVDGYGELRQVFFPSRGGGYMRPTIRVHDTYSQAVERLSEGTTPQGVQPGPEGAAVLHDGSGLVRLRGTTPPQALIEVAVDLPRGYNSIEAGTPVRFVGDHKRSLLLTVNGVVWSRGSWLAGA